MGYDYNMSNTPASVASARDAINPDHYKSHPSGIEIIELTRHMDFCLGNAFKYCARAMHKHDDPIEDYRKALWYLRDYATNSLKKQPHLGSSKLWQHDWEKLDNTADYFFDHEKTNSPLRFIYHAAFTTVSPAVVASAITSVETLIIEHSTK